MEFLKHEQEILEIFPKNIKNISNEQETDKQEEQETDEEDNIYWIGILKVFLNTHTELLGGDLVYFITKSNELKKKYFHEVKSTIIQDFGFDQWDILSNAFDNLELYKISEFIKDNSTITQKNINKINSLISIYSYMGFIDKIITNDPASYNIKIFDN